MVLLESAVLHVVEWVGVPLEQSVVETEDRTYSSQAQDAFLKIARLIRSPAQAC